MNLDELLFAVILVLGVSIIFVSISRWLKLGSILGLLAAGVALGPHSPGPVLTDHVDELLSVAEMGVVLFMFTIGLEMQPSKLWSMRRLLLGLGSLQILVTGAIIAFALLAITSISMNAAIIVGIGLALSSTAIVMQTLEEKGDVASDHGKASFAILLMQDLAAVPLLIVIPLLSAATEPGPSMPLWEPGAAAVGAVAGVIVVGRYLLPLVLTWTARAQSTAALGAIVLVAVLAAALIMEKAGLSMAMGAFLLGMMLAASDFRHQVEVSVSPLKRVLMGLFFVAVGMSINFAVVVELGPILMAIVASIVAIKVVVLALLSLLFGLGRAASLRAAFLLAQCGKFGFVVFAMAHEGGLLTDHDFAIVLVVISLSMALTPLLAKLGNGLAGRLAPQTMPLKELSEEMRDHVVVAGYGRSGRLMCLMLESTDTPYIAFDLDLEGIAEGKSAGHNVHFGDVTDPEMQGAAAFAQAKAVVVTLEDMQAAARLVEELANFYPHLPIHMATPDLATRDAMRARGVAEAVCNLVEGNLQLGGSMLSTAGVVQEDIDLLIEDFRRDDYALLRGLSVDNGGAVSSSDGDLLNAGPMQDQAGPVQSGP